MKRKLLSVLLVTVMVVFLLPLVTFAEPAKGLYVGNQYFTESQMANNQNGLGWKWEAETNTLTLSSYNGNGIMYLVSTEVKKDFKIVIAEGTKNSIAATESTEGLGIFANRNLTISGGGDININNAKDGVGIEVYGNLTITSINILTIDGSEGEAGIYVKQGNMNISDCSEVNITGNRIGFYAEDGDANLSIKGNANIKTHNDHNAAIGFYIKRGNLNLSSDGNVNISAYSGIDISEGNVNIEVDGNLTINLATAGRGIEVYNGNLHISLGGDLAINSSTDSGSGIHVSEGDISLSTKGNIDIKADYGIVAGNSDVTIDLGGDLTIEGFDSGNGGDGIRIDNGRLVINTGGDLSIYLPKADYGYGIYVGKDDINLSTKGNIIINAYYSGIKAYDGKLEIRSDGDLTISGGGGIHARRGDMKLSDIRKVSIDSDSYGISVDEGDLILSGTSTVSITADQHAVCLGSSSKELKINGTGSPLTFKAGENYKAIYNNADDSSPVGGDNLSRYTVNGAPNTNFVQYTLIPQAYTITVQDDQNGTASANPRSATVGTIISLKATPKAGYQFKEWKVLSGNVNIKDNQFTMPAQDVILKAIFEEIPIDYYTITIETDGNGTASATPVSAGQGTEITLLATPKNGYQLKEWQVIAGSVTVKDDKFTMPAQDVTLKAVFEETPVEHQPDSQPSPADNNEVLRTYGTDRIATAIKLSKKQFEKSDNILIVRSDIFPDSLTASVLAKALECPILLTNPIILDSRVADEIQRLGAKQAYIIGGQNSVSDEAYDQIKALTDKIERIAGKDRYETSALVAEKIVEIVGKKGLAIIASGENYPDALSISPYAAREDYPILLVKKSEIPQTISDMMLKIGIERTYLIGGPKTIDSQIEEKLPGCIERIAGANRYATSAKIAKLFFSHRNKAYIASGENFADALVLGPIAGINDTPILLVFKNQIPNDIQAYIQKYQIENFEIVGGPNTVADTIKENLKK